MNETFKQLLILFTGAVLGALLKYVYEYKGMVHKELWVRRYETYKTMFSLAGRFPLYLEKAAINYKGLLHTSEKMRDWFFTEGGLLLSVKTRNKYFKVQKSIQEILDNRRNVNTDD